jgi:endonuclease-3
MKSSGLPRSRPKAAVVPAKTKKRGAAKIQSGAKSKGSSRRPQLTQAAIDEIFRRFAAANPDPKSELEFVNPFTLLVAVVLSAQMTDKGVNKATGPLFEKADTPEKMVKLGQERIAEYIRNVNFGRTKAKNVAELSRILAEKHGGQVPEDFEALIALPGVGRKTANVVLNTVFGHETVAVDTHILRVSNRTGLARGETPDEISAKLTKLIPKEFLRHAHHWLILHGRYVCKARVPDCPNCIVRDLCAYKHKTPG